MSDDLTTDVPDLTKPLSRFNAAYWAQMHGITAALDPAPWSVLCALYCHLPKCEPGKGRLEAMTGRSKSTVDAARKVLRSCGLIDYVQSAGGSRRECCTKYRLADIRNRDVANEIIRRLRDGAEDRTGPTIDPVDDRPGTGPTIGGEGAEDRTGTGPTIGPKVLNGSSQRSSQEKIVGAASPPAALSGGSLRAVERKAKSPSARESKLTPDVVAAVCADLGSMKTYLTSGPLNWERHQKSETDFGVEHWSAQEFAGYYWFRVSAWRSQKNVSLSLPAMSKLIGIMSNLLKQMPAQQLVSVISYVVHYFDPIRWMLGRAGNTVALDETSLVNPLVKNTANNLMRATQEQMEGILAQYHAAREAAAA